MQSKVNQSRIGADAEELSEELDVIIHFKININENVKIFYL